jgi:hypothetical protein
VGVRACIDDVCYMAAWGLLCEVMRVELTIRTQGIGESLQLDFYRDTLT